MEFMKAIKVRSRSLLYLQHHFHSSLPSAIDKNKFRSRFRSARQNHLTSADDARSVLKPLAQKSWGIFQQVDVRIDLD